MWDSFLKYLFLVHPQVVANTVRLYLILSKSLFHFWMPCPWLLYSFPMANTPDSLTRSLEPERPGSLEPAWWEGWQVGHSVKGWLVPSVKAELSAWSWDSLRHNLHSMAHHGVGPRLGLGLMWLPGLASSCSLSFLSVMANPSHPH